MVLKKNGEIGALHDPVPLECRLDQRSGKCPGCNLTCGPPEVFKPHPIILAPLRGYTDVIFRNVYLRHFKGLDEAVAPFVTSTKGRRIKASHLRDLNPTENRAIPVVPQILSNDADEFVCLANTLFDLGYKEVNWNLGCPYPMVANKKRGSGLLPHADRIDRLLDAILGAFNGSLSLKIRLGRNRIDEMERLIPVFNRYPLRRVIVHPRTGVQMYTGSVHLDAFETCLTAINHPVVYNGDINDLEGFRDVFTRFPTVSGWMLGRGVMADPFLPESIKTGCACIPSRADRFAAFHDDLLKAYCQRFAGPGHVLDRMKGLWRYFAATQPNGAQNLKRVRKAGSLERYRRIVDTCLYPQDEK
ncbi:MAG: tRNA dihydrouridine synthase DusB [Deltaproteobacteria bacterium]|nr:MAG: tRNA dihydrouridine synthase DusB [Deltaproteobacteria bacterium]